MAIPNYIHFTESPAKVLNTLLAKMNPDHIAILVDENTKEHCLPLIQNKDTAEVIEIRSGEVNKNLDTCTHIWSRMTDIGFGRQSVLVNLGGGVIGDMGGFCAATYKRGVRFVNIPTTLLAAVDANIGGKLGVDFQGFKNHIGLFQDPDAVIISDQFLATLPMEELRSGFAEVIKHGLIYDKHYYDQVTRTRFPDHDWMEVIRASVGIKGDVVDKDPRESGLRKILNFGHTLGHGIETYKLNASSPVLHGEAVAIGMILEAHLSYRKGYLSMNEVNELARYLTEIYPFIELPPVSEVIALTKQDKKNTAKGVQYSLLESYGKCTFNEPVETGWVEDAFDYYTSLFR